MTIQTHPNPTNPTILADLGQLQAALPAGVGFRYDPAGQQHRYGRRSLSDLDLAAIDPDAAAIADLAHAETCWLLHTHPAASGWAWPEGKLLAGPSPKLLSGLEGAVREALAMVGRTDLAWGLPDRRIAAEIDLHHADLAGDLADGCWPVGIHSLAAEAPLDLGPESGVGEWQAALVRLARAGLAFTIGTPQPASMPHPRVGRCRWPWAA